MHSLERDILQAKLRVIALENNGILDRAPDCDSLQIRALINRYFALLYQNSLKWAQLARSMWVCNSHKHKSLLSHIIGAHGIVHTDKNQIEYCSLSFYSSLWTDHGSSSLSDLIHLLPSTLIVFFILSALF